MAENYEKELREQAEADLERERQRIERVEVLLLEREETGRPNVLVASIRGALADVPDNG